MTKRNRPSSDGSAVPFSIDIKAQPDEATCGATCLEAIYRYYGDDVALESIVTEVRHLPDGGTLAVYLGSHALGRGYRATIYTYNLRIFDPSWFTEAGVDLKSKLNQQRAFEDDPKFRLASDAYVGFLDGGGSIQFEDLTAAFLRRHFDRSSPVLAGLSATYLYRSRRELGDRYDDIRGDASGHFVVLSGNDGDGNDVRVADPYALNPFGRQNYTVSMDRLSGAIYLGVLTYDANLLVIEPNAGPED